MKKSFLILAVALVFMLSACSFSFEKSVEVSDWEDEVLLAQTCGLSGMSCCLEKEAKCEFGQVCCFDPNNSSAHQCASECVCGEEESYCCDNNECNEGLSCHEGRCEKCGEKNEACCSGNECNDDFLCFNNTCVSCGESDTPCCPGEVECLEGDVDNIRLQCIGEVCKNCGRDGKTKCVLDSACDSGFFLTNSICLQCGGFNQPCCEKKAETDYICDESLGLSCERGFCLENNLNNK
jgi:hypothetical protein